MEFYDSIQLRGSLQIHLMNPAGEVVLERKIENTVVTVGRVWILKQLESVHNTTQVIGYLAIGSDTTAPATSQSALGLEVTRHAIGTFDTTNLTANPPSWQAQVSFATNEANTTLAEAGMFNSSAVGTMINRATFASFVKATSNTLAISFTLSN